MRKSNLLLVLAAVCAATSSVWAQSSRASLGGRVTDAQGAAVPNAEVAVVSEDTAVKQTTRTNDQGNWVVQPSWLSISLMNWPILAAADPACSR